jgi:hypothetical protein
MALVLEGDHPQRWWHAINFLDPLACFLRALPDFGDLCVRGGPMSSINAHNPDIAVGVVCVTK